MLWCAVKAARRHELGDAAAALSYYAFTSLPALLLVCLGFFGLLAGPKTVEGVVERLSEVAPQEAVTLLSDGLDRAIQRTGGGVAMIAIGLGLALWTAIGAMSALMRALNRVYGLEENRGFVRLRLTALALVAALATSVALVAGLLVLGPPLSRWLDDASGAGGALRWVWWTAEWPLLAIALVLAFAAVLRLGPSRTDSPARALTLGAAVAASLWLAASGLFSLYVSRFGSYDKTWGSLAAVIVMLVWLWIGGLAVLFGAEIDAELERRAESDRLEISR